MRKVVRVVDPMAVGGEKAHDVEMSEKAQRRRFTAASKLKVVPEADRAEAIVEVHTQVAARLSDPLPPSAPA